MSEAAYPQSIPSFTTKRDQVDVNYAAHINRLQSEVRAIASELGTVPRGEYISVRDRLETLQTQKSNVAHHHDDRYWRRTIVTSKGQLLVGTSDQNVEALLPEPDGRVLKTDASTPTGLRWSTLTHADFTDLAGDHYPQYALANGTRGAFLPTAGGTMNGRVVLQGHAEKVIAKGDVSGVATFDAANGSLFTATLIGNTTVSLAGAEVGVGTTMTLVFLQGSTGGWATSWPGSLRWMNGAGPAPTTAGTFTLVTLLSVDGGTFWLGNSYSG